MEREREDEEREGEKEDVWRERRGRGEILNPLKDAAVATKPGGFAVSH